MPFRNIKLIPGMNTQLTPTLNEMGWAVGTALIRFPVEAAGQPQVIGGWQQKNATPLVGTPRGIVSWSTLPGTISAGAITPLVGIGTSSKVYIWDYTTAHDVTPIAFSGSLYGSWFQDHWGEEWVGVQGFSPSENTAGSPIYNWKPASGYATPAAAISGAPPAANGVLVSSPQQQMIAWGVPVPGSSSWGSTQDPMLIAWSDYSNYSSWFGSATNAAGSFRLTQGSKIMAIVPVQGQLLVFTDSSLYSMQFLAGNLIWGFQQLGTNCGAISPRCITTIGGRAFWWSNTGNFFTYDGVVTPIPCPVRDLCLNAILPSQVGAWAINGSSNSRFNEVRFDFPPSGGLEARAFVSVNILNNTWNYGVDTGLLSIGRTAMTDYVPTVGVPIGCDRLGSIWYQETGATIDTTVSGGTTTAIPWALQSGYADISDGENFMFIDSVYPDSTAVGESILLTLSAKDYPSSTPATAGPFDCGAAVTEIPCRLRGREIAVTIANNQNLNPWRLGLFRTRIATDGRR